MQVEEETFKIGDKIVYPAHGVGVIESIEDITVEGASLSFFSIRILEKEAVIKVPVSKVKRVGIRKVIRDSSVKDIVSILLSPITNQEGEKVSWTVRHREYAEKIKSGSIEEVAEVYRDLMQLRKSKELSFGERRILENAQQFLIGEISEAKKISPREAGDLLKDLFEDEKGED
jgi:CarD family transcriptional regulator